jgi:hypothetical protein
MDNFITEESFETFEGWLRNQGGDAAELLPDQLEMYRAIFEEGRAIFLATPKLDFVHSTPHTQGRPQHGSICGAEFLYCLGAAGT